MTMCQMCEKEIIPSENTGSGGPWVAMVGKYCSSCGFVMCKDCQQKPHDCSENLIKQGWIDAPTRDRNVYWP
jgi:hypothetical protein